MFKKLPVGKFLTNCYIIADDLSREAAVIDPAGDFPDIKAFIEQNALKVKYVLLTHGHGDHIVALNEVLDYTKAPLGINPGDEHMINNAKINMSAEFAPKPIEIKSDFPLMDGDVLKLGSLAVRIIHTPGHTRGGVCILFEEHLMSGDTLFARSIGRTDFEGGDFNEIIHSIKNKLFVLPGHIQVHPGHGGSSTIASEKENNPFF